jgi:hypothetical protein
MVWFVDTMSPVMYVAKFFIRGLLKTVLNIGREEPTTEGYSTIGITSYRDMIKAKSVTITSHRQNGKIKFAKV